MLSGVRVEDKGRSTSQVSSHGSYHYGRLPTAAATPMLYHLQVTERRFDQVMERMAVIEEMLASLLRAGGLEMPRGWPPAEEGGEAHAAAPRAAAAWAERSGRRG